MAKRRKQARRSDGTFRGYVRGYEITTGPQKGGRSSVPVEWVKGYTRSDGVRVRGHYRKWTRAGRAASRRPRSGRGNPSGIPDPGGFLQFREPLRGERVRRKLQRTALQDFTTDERYEIYVEAKRLATRATGETRAYLLLLADLVDQ